MKKRKASKTDAQITDVKICGELNAATLKMYRDKYPCSKICSRILHIHKSKLINRKPHQKNENYILNMEILDLLKKLEKNF